MSDLFSIIFDVVTDFWGNGFSARTWLYIVIVVTIIVLAAYAFM